MDRPEVTVKDERDRAKAARRMRSAARRVLAKAKRQGCTNRETARRLWQSAASHYRG